MVVRHHTTMALGAPLPITTRTEPRFDPEPELESPYYPRFELGALTIEPGLSHRKWLVESINFNRRDFKIDSNAFQMSRNDLEPLKIILNAIERETKIQNGFQILHFSCGEFLANMRLIFLQNRETYD